MGSVLKRYQPGQFCLIFSMRTRCILFILLITAALSGCQASSYYAQAIQGQFSILRHRQPVDRLIQNHRTDPWLKEKLALVLELRDFAKNKLHLPVDNQYLSYVDLHRPYAVWNVFAAPEFDLAPKTWCFPIVGCTAYRGYFSENDAHRYARNLKTQGYDIYVGGVTAYSTLGWFDDPVFSTVVHLENIDLAALIFHELAHQVLYVKDDTRFNEGFATAVEQEGVRRWLIASNNQQAYEAYMADHRRTAEFIQLIMTCRSRLETLYDMNLSTHDKRQNKARIFRAMRNEYEQLKQRWEGYSGFDSWFLPPLNNAKVISVSMYYDIVPQFLNVMKKTNGDLKLFYAECRKLAKKPAPERHLFLQAY
jgi:predicted aminopeptidase